MTTETRKKLNWKKTVKQSGYFLRKVLRLEKKNDGVKDDKSVDDDTGEVR